MMSHAKSIMLDASLEWNVKKSKVIELKRGAVNTTAGDLILKDGSKIECLKDEETYKFLGIPEREEHDVRNIVDTLHNTIRRRANVVWTSPLSDVNKVVATNIFVQSCAEYFMWTQSINILDLRKMDECIRDVMNRNNSKYSLQINSSLYLRRNKGGRGLKNMEMNYKCTKIKTAIKILNDVDPKMVLVRKFDMLRKERLRKSVINDAIQYSKNDFDAKLSVNGNDFTFEFKKDDNSKITNEYHVVAEYLKEKIDLKFEENLKNSTWQGLLINERLHDDQINMKECFFWNFKWKTCSTEFVNDIQSIYLQTVPTLTFKKFRGGENITYTNCRICKKNEAESIRHILSHCEGFLRTFYKIRHDKVLQHILYNFLHKRKIIEKCPPWYSKVEIKSKYEDDDITLLWDIPEYSGKEDEEEEKTLRPDGK